MFLTYIIGPWCQFKGKTSFSSQYQEINNEHLFTGPLPLFPLAAGWICSCPSVISLVHTCFPSTDHFLLSCLHYSFNLIHFSGCIFYVVTCILWTASDLFEMKELINVFKKQFVEEDVRLEFRSPIFTSVSLGTTWLSHKHMSNWKYHN